MCQLIHVKNSKLYTSHLLLVKCTVRRESLPETLNINKTKTVISIKFFFFFINLLFLCYHFLSIREKDTLKTF